MKVTEIYKYLNKLGLADQVHLRNGNQIVFYHWNKGMTDLEPTLTIENNRIEKMYYARKIMPKMYVLTHLDIENDLANEEFIRDYRD